MYDVYHFGENPHTGLHRTTERLYADVSTIIADHMDNDSVLVITKPCKLEPVVAWRCPTCTVIHYDKKTAGECCDE